MPETILQVENLHAYYGLSHILFGVSLAVREGQAVGLFGRNGMGKTTTMKSIMGIVPPESGTVDFRGEAIAGYEPHVIANRGVGYVPDDRRIFPYLTVLENIQVARKKKEGRWTLDNIFGLFPHLEGLKNRKGGHLSGGEQQMLTLARTLAGNPLMIILDEPFEGLAPLIVQDLAEKLLQIKKEGIAMLISEQNISFACDLLDQVTIIEKGEIRYEGSFQDFQGNDPVQKTYLGV